MIEVIRTFVKIANYLDMIGCDKHADKFDDMCHAFWLLMTLPAVYLFE